MSIKMIIKYIVLFASLCMSASAAPIFDDPRSDSLIALPNQNPQLLMDSPHWGNGIDCSSCHLRHNSAGAQLTNVAGNANLCMSCHNAAGLAGNKPFAEADRAQPGVSGTSHAWDVPAGNVTHGADPPSDPQMSSRVMSGDIVCSTCHNQHSQEHRPFLRASNYGNALCKDCHAVRNVASYRDDPNNKGSHPVGKAYPTSDSRFYSAPQNPDLLLVDPDRVECTSCHGVHYTDSGNANNGLGDGYLLRTVNDNALCESCHTYTSHQGMDCLRCHQPHNPNRSNIFMIRDSVDTPRSGVRTVVFIAETGQNSFADGDGAYDGICEVCHTRTKYHRNSQMGNHNHNTGANCTGCHPHNAAFAPQGGCSDCHDRPKGGRRQITGNGGDFDRTSHHVKNGVVQDSDCTVCHYMNDHQGGVVKLLDPDQGEAIVYEFSSSNPEGLENFCLNCHDADGALAGDGATPFSDGATVPNIYGESGSLWQNSAHNSIGFSRNSGAPITCYGDGDGSGCHANAHGSNNIKLLSAPSGVALSDFCFNCHTEGVITNNAISGSGLANDIEQAFNLSRTHDLGGSFTVDGYDFTLDCTTCHNPHVVTGKHWDVDNGVSPITRPDFNDPVNNPRAMGTTLWGAASGQKMDDFAATASGSGGWYFNVARGQPYGDVSLPFDQPAVYQPPKKGSGYNFEFDGDVLPDYATFCLDCHTHRMGTHPPVNWGQGVACTGNSVDPPDQRVECGAQHGLGAANKPYAWDPNSTFYGATGNPDPIFHEPYVQRGRGAGQFMRWPYESAERNAGINFVMSCTDCHEAHGSNIGSMIRSNPNNGTGSTTWNTMCNNCHYYYGYQHAGMSCGSASCHEANSIHRIVKNTESGGVNLWHEPSRPTTTPEISTVQGTAGSNELTVTFTDGVYTNDNRTGALTPTDFVLTDVDDDNPKSITSVLHTPGGAVATLILSASLIQADIGADVLATRGVSIWDSDGDPAGPWPVAIQ